MAEITAAKVKELRERTGSGMMDCKKALAETDGDMEKAIDYLREKGLAKAAKKAERNASDGRIFYVIGKDGKLGAMIELNSETDFVAKTDEFNELGSKITAHLAAKEYATPAELLESVHESGSTVNDLVTAIIAKLGENIVLKRFARFDSANGRAFCYIHSNYKVGALLELEAEDKAVLESEAFAELGHEICMQIAAANPLYLVSEDIPEEVLEREKAVYKQQLIDEGKPADKVDKIIPGKLRKYYETTCLLEQEYIRDSDKRVKDLIAETGKKLGTKVTVRRFARFAIGE
ncbi:MAG: elongation factor Ts [Synergistaceae bacterium]|nr:elongation factor Ts [Synergistaceae bacterium]MBQ9595088.1 elongation factor Ts [Synergistaceae bacterium]